MEGPELRELLQAKDRVEQGVEQNILKVLCFVLSFVPCGLARAPLSCVGEGEEVGREGQGAGSGGDATLPEPPLAGRTQPREADFARNFCYLIKSNK